MSTKAEIYCLDANVLIQAWQKYYSPKFCPGYWDILNTLGIQKRIFISELVYEEITRTEDDLSKWLKGSNIPIHKIDEPVTRCLQSIFSHNPLHKNLVDNTKARSLADPWVIAHAINEKATVVTKEEKVTALNSKKIKSRTYVKTWVSDGLTILNLLMSLALNLHATADNTIFTEICTNFQHDIVKYVGVTYSY